MCIQNRLYSLCNKCSCLLFRSADISGRFHGFLKLFDRQVKCRICCNSLKKVVIFSFYLNGTSCFHGKLTDTLMQFLTVSAGFYCIHHDVLGSHKRKFCHHVFLNNFRINNQSVYNVQAQIQNAVNCKESFRNAETFVCRVIQCSLKPLCSGSNCRIQCIYHYVSGQRCNTLASHRITLICHRRGTDL